MHYQQSSIRPRQAAELLGVSLPTLWRWAARRPDFPRARRLSPRCTVFDTGEVIRWRDARTKPAVEAEAAQ